jgi:hypothetical protein
MGPLAWPVGAVVDDTTFLSFTAGKELRSSEKRIGLRPWKPATDLKDSRAVDGMVELPTICGQHVVYYPTDLVHEAMRGRFYVFMTACECPTAYLIHTEADGAHCKAADTAEAISAMYEGLPGPERSGRRSRRPLRDQAGSRGISGIRRGAADVHRCSSRPVEGCSLGETAGRAAPRCGPASGGLSAGLVMVMRPASQAQTRSVIPDSSRRSWQSTSHHQNRPRRSRWTRPPTRAAPTALRRTGWT